jgi:protoporphyrinogen oxidase
MRKWAGNRVYELMWQPLMEGNGPYHAAGQYGLDVGALKSRTTRLGTFQGGFQAFADALAERLREMGVEIRLSQAVQGIHSDAQGGVSLDIEGGDAQRFDQCLVTTSPALLARLAPSLPGNYLEGLLKLRSMGAVVVVLALKRQLSEQGYYWFNLPKSAGFPFLALVEHTNYLPPEHYGGDHAVCGDYLMVGHEYFQFETEELLERFLPALSRLTRRSPPIGCARAGYSARPTPSPSRS